MVEKPKFLEVVRVYRDDSVPDIPISFPPLENLHLEMMECKKKLKPGLPLVPPSKPPSGNLPRVSDPTPAHEDSDIELEGSEEESEIRSRVPSPPPQSRKRESTPVASSQSDDEELVAELGEESHAEREREAEESTKEEPTPVDEEEDLYAGLTPEEREVKEKDLYLWKFYTLRKQWRGKDIPVYTKHSDLNMMKDDYNRTVKELMLEDNVESYRTYLMSGFLAIEFIATQWVGIDLGGFTLQQTQMMSKYERLLIELGAKNADSSMFSGLPVEIRLIGLVLFSAVIFYVGKIVSAKFGNTVGEMFKGFVGNPPDYKTNREEKVEEEQPKSGKMRGPRPMAL